MYDSSDSSEEDDNSSFSNRSSNKRLKISGSNSKSTTPTLLRTVFHRFVASVIPTHQYYIKCFFLPYRALDAVSMSWDNMHLKNILSSDTYSSHVPDNSSSGSFNSQGQPLWHGKTKIENFCYSFKSLLLLYRTNSTVCSPS